MSLMTTSHTTMITTSKTMSQMMIHSNFEAWLFCCSSASISNNSFIMSRRLFNKSTRLPKQRTHDVVISNKANCRSGSAAQHTKFKIIKESIINRLVFVLFPEEFGRIKNIKMKVDVVSFNKKFANFLADCMMGQSD